MAFQNPLAVGMAAPPGGARAFVPAPPQQLAWPAAAAVIGALCVGLWAGIAWVVAALL